MAHLVLVQGLIGVLNLVKGPVAGGRAGFGMTGYAAAATAAAVLGAAPTEKTMHLWIMFNHRHNHQDTVGPLHQCKKQHSSQHFQ